MTPVTTSQQPARRPVAGYILASIGVGAIGLVIAILVTVSGIMHSFSAVSESYDEVWDSGQVIGPQDTVLELDNANYTLLTFSAKPAGPGAIRNSHQCTIMEPSGGNPAVSITTQPLTSDQRDQSPYDLSGKQYVNFLHFEARGGPYRLTCKEFGLLSDGNHSGMGCTEVQGILIGLGSVMIAGGLFVMGVVNSSRNKKAQAARLR